MANYDKVLESVIEGNPCAEAFASCPEHKRIESSKNALLDLQGFHDVTVAKVDYENEGLNAKLARENGAAYIKLKYVHRDRAKTKWKITASVVIGTVMRPLVTEEIFSDVLLADSMGKVLYHQPSRGDPSGFEFGNVSSLLHNRDDSGSKNDGAEKGGAGRNEELVSTLPLFNEAPIGGISHTIFAQAANLSADRGPAQTLILVGIVPAGQFHAEARAIPLNHLLLVAGLLLIVFFALP